MASKALKGLTIEIGGDTTKLGKALNDVNKKGSGLSKELGQINRLLKLDPQNTELLAQKQKVLADAIKNTESKLNTLREAEEQVQAQFERGEISEDQYRELKREIIETENKLNQYKNAAKEAADAEKRLADGAEEATEELEEQTDATEETEDATGKLDDSASDLANGGLAAMVAAAAAAVTAIVALAEESREYRTLMGKLDTAFKDSNLSAEAATKTYESLQSVLGETDQAVEASSLLAKMCSNEEELADWTEIHTGVYGVFGASLPVEGLAEAANETIRVGQVTGPLADALNWATESGEEFGIALKQNIEFTKLDKKELAKLTDAQKAEYEAREKQHKEIEEYNKKVAEAASAEDKFNIALENCADEQERQQLITSTLTKLYGSAAKQYKKTNAEVIRANEATEKWNKATAKIGKAVEPVVTDIKELGVTLLEDAGDPLENIAEYIRKTVIPAIEKISKWVKKNMPAIKTGLVGVAAAMVAFKVASIAATVAQKGLKGAIMASTVAQKALALAQAATPWGLIITAVAGLAAALVKLNIEAQKATGAGEVLTEQEKELMETAKEAADAFQEQKKATKEALQGITANMGYVSDLSDELFTLADASGKVAEEDQARAKFILNEMNEALGTEYEMLDGVIQQYGTLTSSIKEVMQTKLANSLLEASESDYLSAREEQTRALEAVSLRYEEYQAQLDQTKKVENDYETFAKEYRENITSGMYTFNQIGKAIDDIRLANLQAKLDNEKGLLAETETAYNEAALNYGSHYETIAIYEEAQQAMLEGNYQKTVDMLSEKGGAYGQYSDKVDEETAKVLDTLYEEAVDAGLKANLAKKNFENGVDGYTQEMVDEAEKGYQEALDVYANAYADAESVGEDLGDGLSGGLENKRSGLLAKARSLVAGIINAMRTEADSHSPARKTIDFGEDMGEGAEIGIENKTEDVKRSASRQVAAVIEAYQNPKDVGQRVFRSVADQQAARYAAGHTPVTSDNGPMLERILNAIEEGHVLILDGDAVVGGTAAKMDNALGRRRALASRGAL